MKKVCNRDCEHCVYDDCIVDDVTPQEIYISDKFDAFARKETMTAEERKKAEYRERHNRRRRERYHSDTEYRAKYIASAKKYNEEHRERQYETMRRYRERNRETINARQRERMRAKREEKANGACK